MDTNASWLKDGVEAIEEVVKKAMVVTPTITHGPNDRKGRYVVITPMPAGKAPSIEFGLTEPGWHNEYLDSPTELKAFIEAMGAKLHSPAIYISSDKIVMVYSFYDRRDLVTVPLIRTEPWKWLEKPPENLTQRDAIRLLRIKFDGCLGPDSMLVSVLRKVQWTNNGNVESTIQRGKEGLSRQMLAEAAGAANFPDEFCVNVAVFENVKQKVTCRLALELLPEVQRFEIIPFPSQVQQGMAETLEWLREDLKQTKVPTFIGTP